MIVIGAGEINKKLIVKALAAQLPIHSCIHLGVRYSSFVKKRPFP